MTGSGPASGRPCTSVCWCASTPPGRSTGRGPASTVPTYAPFFGLLGRGHPRSTAPAQAQTPPAGGRRHGHPPAPRSPAATATTSPNSWPLLDALHARPVRGKRGGPRRKPDRLLADRGYDHDRYRRVLRRRHIRPLIARRGVAHGSGLGRERWVVERGFADLHNFRRLRIRYDQRRPQIDIALSDAGLRDPPLATSRSHCERGSKSVKRPRISTTCSPLPPHRPSRRPPERRPADRDAAPGQSAWQCAPQSHGPHRRPCSHHAAALRKPPTMTGRPRSPGDGLLHRGVEGVPCRSAAWRAASPVVSAPGTRRCRAGVDLR